jgi:hypothetical protein
MYLSISTPTVTRKIYLIIENLTDILEELNKEPPSAQICGLEGVAGLETGSGSSGGGEGGDGGETAAGEEAGGKAVAGGEAAGEKDGLAESIKKGPKGKASELSRYLNGNEALELIHLESTRQSLLRAQGFLEDKKRAIVRLARSRQKNR